MLLDHFLWFLRVCLCLVGRQRGYSVLLIPHASFTLLWIQILTFTTSLRLQRDQRNCSYQSGVQGVSQPVIKPFAVRLGDDTRPWRVD